MTEFHNAVDQQRFEQGFQDPECRERLVFADYAVQGDTVAILHVEAHPTLRGSGASGQFMKSLADHARAKGLKLKPVCGYAVAWLKRHPEYADVTV